MQRRDGARNPVAASVCEIRPCAPVPRSDVLGGGGAVADFLILKLGKLDQNLEKKLFL